MSKKKDDEIQQKLDKLELAITEDEVREEELAKQEKSQSAKSQSAGGKKAVVEDGDIHSDLYMIGGFVALAVGVLMLFSQMRVGTGALGWLGMGAGGAGFLFLPLLVGIGMLFYNSKWRAGWITCGLGVAVIIFAILSQLVITFPFVSGINFVLIMVPMAAGIALMLKGAGMRKKITKTED